MKGGQLKYTVARVCPRGSLGEWLGLLNGL